ncbi:MAG: SDR family NAD(P)-dependent oxidoreductase [Sporichthyaceae bacterium]
MSTPVGRQARALAPPSGRLRFEGRTALVTGASQGIGRAVALSLAGEGAAVHLVARSSPRLAAAARDGGALCRPLVADLTSEASIRGAVEQLLDSGEVVDLLVHCGGQYARGTVQESPSEDLDVQYQLSVRAPYLLTQMLLPGLRSQPSDIVFMGSTVRPAARLGAYAAAQTAQAALARALRDEMSDGDVRVLTVFPGRTATPRQAQIFRLEGRADEYRPERLLQPEDVAAITLDALCLPRRAEVTEVWLRPAEATY